MTGYRGMSEHLKRQYEELWGAYAPGDYAIGDAIKAPGVSGEVIWSFKRGGQLHYVIASDQVFPVEVRANEVQS